MAGRDIEERKSALFIREYEDSARCDLNPRSFEHGSGTVRDEPGNCAPGRVLVRFCNRSCTRPSTRSGSQRRCRQHQAKQQADNAGKPFSSESRSHESSPLREPAQTTAQATNMRAVWRVSLNAI